MDAGLIRSVHPTNRVTRDFEIATIMHPIAIRLSDPSDSLRIAEIQIATWRSAYSGIVPDRFLSSMSVAAHEQSWRRHIGHPHSPLFVATRAAECIGFCHVTPARDPDLEGGAEVVAIYVAPQCQRQGAGRLLMSSALGFAASSRYESLSLWVLTLNRAGRSFYERAGFTTDGHQKQISISGTVLDEVRYHRRTRAST
ncbi:MAG: hypothetical protein CJBNEKGG_00933 [Prosthecobacter sp.]|nr:hypothetical protein [Prosthecobacter sp.]